jgi:hypothetical protein
VSRRDEKLHVLAHFHQRIVTERSRFNFMRLVSARNRPKCPRLLSHPCFDTPHRRNLRDAHGLTYAIEVGDYFRNLDGEVEEWLFGAAPLHAKQGLAKFKTPRFTRTMSQWLRASANRECGRM